MSHDLSLSKLSRGKGERIGQSIQVIYDDQDLAERFYADFYTQSEDRYGMTVGLTETSLSERLKS
jgi:hypothetical protein